MKIVHWILIYPIDGAIHRFFFPWAPAYHRGIKMLLELKAIEQERK